MNVRIIGYDDSKGRRTYAGHDAIEDVVWFWQPDMHFSGCFKVAPGNEMDPNTINHVIADRLYEPHVSDMDPSHQDATATLANMVMAAVRAAIEY